MRDNYGTFASLKPSATLLLVVQTQNFILVVEPDTRARHKRMSPNILARFNAKTLLHTGNITRIAIKPGKIQVNKNIKNFVGNNTV